MGSNTTSSGSARDAGVLHILRNTKQMMAKMILILVLNPLLVVHRVENRIEHYQSVKQLFLFILICQQSITS